MTDSYFFLDHSCVQRIISKYVKNKSSLGGRPSVDYYNLFATILYGFSFDKCTLRELEDHIKFDLRYIYIMEQTLVDYSTIAKFFNKVIVPNEFEIFAILCRQLQKELNIELEDAFIDGSKFEANANKYKFVWKPTTFHHRLSEKMNRLIHDFNLISDYRDEQYIRSSTVANALSNLNALMSNNPSKELKNANKALNAMLIKVLEYETKENICGPTRKSFYKTDPDATAMCLKSDYYSGLGSNMHAAYNVQILVIRGFVFSYYVSSNRNDCLDFIPTLQTFYNIFSQYPKRVCADAGYGSTYNYAFLDKNHIENYVKFVSWEGNVSGKNPDTFVLNPDNTITCLNQLTGYQTIIGNRHHKTSGSVFFRIDGCNSCKFMPYCKKFMKNTDLDYKIFDVNIDFIRSKQNAEQNLLSPKGIELRINRSIQVEGAFGIQKHNYERDRVRRRGLERVSTETMLSLLGANIAKLFRYYTTSKLPTFWVAPENLEPETFKKPSWKKLAKKGRKVNQKIFKKE